MEKSKILIGIAALGGILQLSPVGETVANKVREIIDNSARSSEIGEHVITAYKTHINCAATSLELPCGEGN